MSVELTEEERKLFAQEIIRLNSITNKLWQKGLDSNFYSMTHTELGVTLYKDMVKRKNIRSIVPNIFSKNNKIKKKKKKGNSPQYIVKLNNSRSFRNFMSL